MQTSVVKFHSNNRLPHLVRNETIRYLNPEQLNAFTDAFEKWSESGGRMASRAKYLLVFLTLRYTGARLNEVLKIEDRTDIDIRNHEIKVVTLKQKKNIYRIVPVPKDLILEYSRIIAQYPDLRGNAYKLIDTNVRKAFIEVADKAGIPRELAHPHVLRHTRAIELLRAGMPITAVRDLLGHSSITTTSIYLQLSNVETKFMMQEKGLL